MSLPTLLSPRDPPPASIPQAQSAEAGPQPSLSRGSHSADELPRATEGDVTVSESNSSPKTVENTARGARRRLRCSICKQSFSRLEHLTRHERSHRNERPFSCNYCDARFTRKDLIKTHNKRHHKDVMQPWQRDNPAHPGETSSISILDHRSAPPDDSSSRRDGATEGYGNVHHNPGHVSDWNSAFPSSNNIPPAEPVIQQNLYNDWNMSSLMEPCHSAIDFDGFLAEMESSHLSHGPQGNAPNPMAPEHSKSLPSCLAFEGYLTTFFDLVLPNIPFIHTTTWQAEQAHPSLLLAMAALGAALCGKDDISLSLHRVARLSVLNHIKSYNFGSKDQPTWVIQSLFLSMSFGTWSGNLALAQQALACQSILAQLVGYVKNPDDSWAKHKDDPDLSWEEWVSTETIIRTKLVVYVFFGNLNVACNVPPALLNSEVNISLPSSECEWLAPTPEAWIQKRKYPEGRSTSFSDALESHMSHNEDRVVKCSAFGSLVMLHAILQQIWHIRQHNPTRNSPEQILSFELALGKWKIAFENNPESSLSAANPHFWLALSSHVLLASAYTRVYTIIGRIRLSTIIHDADVVAGVMRTSIKEIPRSPGSVNAALHAVYALFLPIRLGRIWTNQSDSGACSLHPYTFCSMQLCR
ncbi:hypothetical protein BDY21DRAFT_120491 [Lineolata rhizophorae]|uniref:C2H2-type domain-containing protein n=1 Tax=Lineolata rhizophorae TaxID=578093 RepID=A0A6A6NP79_9PEZI|nr:hypothetical protein BDY21DRAFT_120491 [Lineolata rhizophorae]